jgi:hypothetical protein
MYFNYVFIFLTWLFSSPKASYKIGMGKIKENQQKQKTKLGKLYYLEIHVMKIQYAQLHQYHMLGNLVELCHSRFGSETFILRS